MNKVAKTLLNATGVVFQFIFNSIEDMSISIYDSFQKKRGFDSQFGHETDIASRWNKGFMISKSRKLTRHKSFENLLLCGPTGSGKTQRILLKTLFSLRNCSIVVNDPSKELFTFVSGFSSQFFGIRILNFSDVLASCGYNILSRIKKASDVNKLCHILVSATLDKGVNSDPFWSLQAKSLLGIFIRLILHQPKEYQNMANVLFTLNTFASKNYKKVDRWIVDTRDDKLLLDYKTVVAIPDKTLQSIVATTKSALQIFEDEDIAKVTAHDSLDFTELREKPTILFLHNSISDMKYINILNGIFFEQLYGHILKELPSKKELDLFIILEEASSLYIPMLPVAIANTRKHRVGNFLCVQNPQQLTTFYGKDADNLASNCVTKVFLPGQTSIEVMRDLETYGGKAIHIDDKGVERIRPLITVDEIRLLETNRSLILSSNNPLIKGRTSPCYKSWKYKSYMKIPPLPLQGDIPDEPILLLGEMTIKHEDKE